ncbi:Mlr7403 protein [Vibrio maritimus]|uniref:Mlr7403 protein n=1 Tax=Vibrio maritimus TaxID=990268 RepID=A0A090SQF8_9VIBR|nr:Mlr7403 protein [Vibrio maritimus]
MELYDSEEQQVEAIKDWWKENGKAVVLGVVVGLGGLFGWRYYQDSVVQAQEAASEQYSKAVESMVVSGVDASADVQASSIRAKRVNMRYLLRCNWLKRR